MARLNRAGDPLPRVGLSSAIQETCHEACIHWPDRSSSRSVRIVPVFGPNALDVSPRIGHIHVTVDDAPWRWADASGEPLIIRLTAPLRKHLLRQPAERRNQDSKIPRGP